MSSGVNGTVCTPEEFALSLQSNAPITCLSHGQSISLALTAEAGFISMAAIIYLFVLLARNVNRYRRHYPKGKWRLLQEPTDVYMFFLLCFDAVQALGFLLDTKWANDGKTTTGSVCIAQGTIHQIAAMGIALTTLAITIQTFVTVFWRTGIHARMVAYGVVFAICVFIILWAAIAVSISPGYETPTPYWCWIAPKYKVDRIAGEYLWLWLTLFAAAILYVPLYFWSQGRLSVDRETWWKFHFHPRTDLDDTDGRKWRALSMLAYPIAYSIIILPLSVARWMQFEGDKVLSVGTFIGQILFGFSGAVNVLLLLVTRPQLLLFERPPEGEVRISSPTEPRHEFKLDVGPSNHSDPEAQELEIEHDDDWDLPGRKDIALDNLS